MVELTDNATIVVAKNQVSCDLAGEAAILNLSSGVYFGLNPVGARIWSLIQQPKTVAEIRNTILSEYDADQARVDADLNAILGQMAEHGLIEVS